jgi:hypothetical protein
MCDKSVMLIPNATMDYTKPPDTHSLHQSTWRNYQRSCDLWFFLQCDLATHSHAHPCLCSLHQSTWINYQWSCDLWFFLQGNLATHSHAHPRLHTATVAAAAAAAAASVALPKFHLPSLHLNMLCDPSWKTRFTFYVDPVSCFVYPV